MRSNSSRVAGWLVPARGTCSRKLSSLSVSMRTTRTPACASVSERQSPTGPAPMTITRSDALSMRQARLRIESEWGGSGFRHDILGGTDPPLVGEIEDDTGRILIFRLVVGVLGGRAAFEIFAAGVKHLLLRRVEVIDPHSKMVEAGLHVRLLLEQGYVDHAV